jgi:hypothetical protein
MQINEYTEFNKNNEVWCLKYEIQVLYTNKQALILFIQIKLM